MLSTEYKDDWLHVDGIHMGELAKQYGTPLYVYSYKTLKKAYDDYSLALSGYTHKICYAVKANSTLAILNSFAKLGSGFDIVSGGELERVIAAGGDPQQVIFSGVGKHQKEIEKALEFGIYCFNVESASELLKINAIAASVGTIAPIALRVNPDINANVHPYISTGLKDNKFGIDIHDAFALYQVANTLSHIKITGIAYHIGSQLTEIAPFIEALERILLLVDELKQSNIFVEHIDIGGGLGIRYDQEEPLKPAEYLSPLLKRLAAYGITVIVEPGRSLVGYAGLLITQVEYIKSTSTKNFAIVDAAMNDLIRPCLYQAWHSIIPVKQRAYSPLTYDVVGPVCETADFLGKSRLLAIEEQDFLAIENTGAYSFTMSSNYNSRPRAAEILLKDNHAHLIRARENIADLFALEKIV